MSDSTRWLVGSSYDGIAAATQQTESWLDVRGGDGAVRHLAALVIEELMTNCIKYGYDDEAEHTIAVELAMAGDEFRISIEDDGRAFNPLQEADPDLTTVIEEREIGGLGIFLLRGMSDSMSYERVGDKNRVTVTKRLLAGPAGQ